MINNEKNYGFTQGELKNSVAWGPLPGPSKDDLDIFRSDNYVIEIEELKAGDSIDNYNHDYFTAIVDGEEKEFALCSCDHWFIVEV
jgi:hypothetical protein